jgi:hypothetical protein
MTARAFVATPCCNVLRPKNAEPKRYSPLANGFLGPEQLRAAVGDGENRRRW